MLQPTELELAADAQHQLAGRAQPFGSGLTRMVQRQSSAVNLTRLGRDSEVRRLMDEVGPLADWTESLSRSLHTCINVSLLHEVSMRIVGNRAGTTRDCTAACWPDRGRVHRCRSVCLLLRIQLVLQFAAVCPE